MNQPGPPWEAVIELTSPDEALLLAGRLESEGIEARVDPPETHGVYGPSTSQILGYRFRVLVPPHRVLEAAAIIDSIRREGNGGS